MITRVTKCYRRKGEVLVTNITFQMVDLNGYLVGSVTQTHVGNSVKTN